MSALPRSVDPPTYTTGKTTTINQTISSSGTHTITTETTFTPTIPSLPPTAPQSKSRLYFAYGSNLSTTQMASRCPDAVPKHLAWIGGWAFIVNQRGFANVVPDAVFNADTGRYNPGVFGVLYEISAEDEELLDGYEGVPGGAYEKVEMLVWVQAEGKTDGGGTLERMALVYVDRKRTLPSSPRPEYVRRMNRGIREASGSGLFPRLPAWYVEEVMRPFIPESEG